MSSVIRHARWMSWTAFEAAVSPKHVTQSAFDATRDTPQLLTQTLVAYSYGVVLGMITSTVQTIDVWTNAKTAWLQSPDRIKNLQSGLERDIDLACGRIEELLLLLGDASRLKRLLEGTRGLRFVVGEKCHHNAIKVMPALVVLARECAHDLVDQHVDAARQVHQALLLNRQPASVRRYFEEARDSLLLQHQELGAFAACRGLERGCKSVAAAHGLNLVVGNAAPRPLADCDLNDVLQAFAQCEWSDGTRVLDRASLALVQFVRQMRNVAGHAATSSVEQWTETAVLAASATCRIMERAAEPNQTITPGTVTRTW